MNYPFNPSPSYSFSVAKKIQSQFLLPQISMGPSQYHPQTEKKGGTLNFGSYSQRKMVFAQEVLTPGPLHYTIKTYRSQKVSFANSKKPLNKLSLSPGPGQYLPIDESHYGLGGSISRTLRNQNFDNKIPWVGHYPIKSTLNNLAFKFKQLHKRAYTDHMKSWFWMLFNLIGFNEQWSCSYIQQTETPGLGTYQRESFTQNRVSSKHSNVYSKELSKILNKCFSLHESKQSSNKLGPLILMRSYQQDQNSSLISQQSNISDSYNKMREYGKLKKRGILRRISTPNPRKISRSPGPAIYADIKFKQNTKLGFMPASQKSETFKPKEGPGVGEYSKILPFGKIYNKHITPKRQFFKFKDLNKFDFDQ